LGCPGELASWGASIRRDDLCGRLRRCGRRMIGSDRVFVTYAIGRSPDEKVCRLPPELRECLGPSGTGNVWPPGRCSRAGGGGLFQMRRKLSLPYEAISVDPRPETEAGITTPIHGRVPAGGRGIVRAAGMDPDAVICMLLDQPARWTGRRTGRWVSSPRDRAAPPGVRAKCGMGGPGRRRCGAARRTA